MNPLVSIIVPVYNVEDYIKESLLSICRQSYKNIELIIVDDESRDNSVLIAEKVLQSFKFQYRIIKEENKGLPGARNTGLKEAIGEYVCFVDSDDVISKDHILNSVNALIESKLSVCYSDFEFTEEKCRQGGNTDYNGYEYCDKDKLFGLFSERKIRIHCCSLLVKKTVFDANNLWFNKKLRFGEDVDFMWRLFSITRGIVHVKQNSYKYLIRNNSIMNSATIDKWEIFASEFNNTIKFLKQSYPENSDIYDIVYNRTMLGLSRIIAKNTEYPKYREFVSKHNKKEISNALRRCKDWKIRLTAVILSSDRLFYIINHSKYVW